MVQETQTRAPWTKIFTAFKVALDLKKLLLAAAGILIMALGWWVIGLAFYELRKFPEWKDYEEPNKSAAERTAIWNAFKARRNSWNLLHELAGSDPERVDAADVTNDLNEFLLLHEWERDRKEGVDQVDAKAAKVEDKKLAAKALATYKTKLAEPRIKPFARLRTLPWFEYRGPNPYLNVASLIEHQGEALGERGVFVHWLFGEQAPVLLEPLYKFLTPLVYLFDSHAGWWERFYLTLIIVWTLVVWGFFGGAICRIAAVQVARSERITLMEAIAFARERFLSYVAAPVFPLIGLAGLVLLLMIFGWVEWIPWFGDLFAGLFWPLVILIGFTMAIVLVGLAGWPLMIATVSTEGSDSFDALSRSYSYLYGAPWQYLWYNFLAIAYGAALVFFVGFMASLMVFLGKWGVSNAVGLASSDPASDREPSYLFYYAPTSFGWRDLLIASNQRYVETRETIRPSGQKTETLEFTDDYEKNISTMNRVGAFLVALWIYPLFLLVIGFSYSYFWCASTIIYFLMRRHVDDTEMAEVHLEDEELEDPFLKPAPPAPAAAPPAPSKPGTLSLNVIDAPPATSAPASSRVTQLAPETPANPPPSGSA